MKRGMTVFLFGVALAALPARGASGQVAGPADSVFPHARHGSLFPTCVTCHAGAVEPGAPIWPAAASCASCHDGQVRGRITWTPPVDLPRTNLRFSHAVHGDSLRTLGRDSVACVTCHQQPDARFMQVRLAVVTRCLECHGVQGPHIAAPDTACATCHVTLPRAVRLTQADVRRFPKPATHDVPGFVGRGPEGHGTLAATPTGIAASCATCHARQFCVTCHVDAPEQRVILALEPDPRGAIQRAALTAPRSHDAITFPAEHGLAARAPAAGCRTCHTQESCLTCHLRVNPGIERLALAGPGRATGAVVTRRPPLHTPTFLASRHGTEASAAPNNCASCHGRQDCLQCHRPLAASGPSYHPATFLAEHPAAAYVRATSCGQCHNQAAFCQSCHLKAGLTSTRTLGSGYHDAKQSFIAGHGQAARQSLETCVSCHVERDCLTCHSANGGRRFNPHGVGFDAERWRKKNPDACAVCHGNKIPGGS